MGEKLLYWQGFSGISGDMALASLVDAGADRIYILAQLKKLNIEPYELEWRQVTKCGIGALKLEIQPDPEYVHGYRNYPVIVKLIEQTDWPAQAKRRSIAVFTRLAEAEAKVHRVSLEQVHFHEVGALDSIVDICGVSLALEHLGITSILGSPLPAGSGIVRCDHGLYPIPAPAALELLKGIPIADSQLEGEVVTPTGAAIYAALVKSYQAHLPSMIVNHIGYGAGTRDYSDRPNIIRAMVGKPIADSGPQMHHHSIHSHTHSHENLTHRPHSHSHPSHPSLSSARTPGLRHDKFL